jgi:glutamate synthase domain-containing protein 3
MSTVEVAPAVIDLAQTTIRELNARLQSAPGGERYRVLHPAGRHSVAVGLDSDVTVEIEGHVGYYCAGMNASAALCVHGNAGPGLAENMMSGCVEVTGSASQYVGATAHGGLIVIRGDASSRCAISLKGADVVVQGSIGHMGAFMAQSGRLVVCGDAGDALGDSLYEARLYVRGSVASLGADCVEKEMRAEHAVELGELLTASGVDAEPGEFRRYGSARTLYNFRADRVD